MPNLNFQVEGAEALIYAALPQLAFRLAVTNADVDEAIHTVALRCQIQIEATRRQYIPDDQQSLTDLFGEPHRWNQTLRSLLWTHASVVVPAFRGSTSVDLPVPCSFDFNAAATKYFHGVSEGDIPLCLQFSGTVFYACPDGGLQVAPISWDKEAHHRLPVSVWRDMMDSFYPNSAWLSLRRDVFERLYQYKVRHGAPTWEQAFEELLAVEETVGK